MKAALSKAGAAFFIGWLFQHLAKAAEKDAGYWPRIENGLASVHTFPSRIGVPT